MIATMAAAICYRRSHTGIDFLLVRTSSGSRWTFPKGHIENKESPAEAATREAEEEAGVRGNVWDQPVIEYWFPNDVDDSGQNRHLVLGFLLEVTEEFASSEPGRSPTWWVLEEAKRRLGERREREFAEEHVRVLDIAVGELIRHASC